MGLDEFAIYFSVTRITWSLSIAWIIFACHYGYGGIINRILSANFFIPITKISYCAYLIHPVIMVSYMFAQKDVFFATYFTLVRNLN
jgi:peptidoglycan/LPS O-acetylase OafA/YrhL